MKRSHAVIGAFALCGLISGTPVYCFLEVHLGSHSSVWLGEKHGWVDRAKIAHCDPCSPAQLRSAWHAIVTVGLGCLGVFGGCLGMDKAITTTPQLQETSLFKRLQLSVSSSPEQGTQLAQAARLWCLSALLAGAGVVTVLWGWSTLVCIGNNPEYVFTLR